MRFQPYLETNMAVADDVGVVRQAKTLEYVRLHALYNESVSSHFYAKPTKSRHTTTDELECT